MSKFKFELGQEVTEKVTGYTGTIMSRIEYFTGCNHYGIASHDLSPDGKVKDWEHFDESRLVIVSKEKSFDRKGKDPTSGPGHNPPMMG